MKSNPIDPVCGMIVDPAQPGGTTEYAGTRYYFCSKGCQNAFEQEPIAYLPPTA